MKLKTLKDIRMQMTGPPEDNPPHGEKGHICCSYGADVLELRQEATKWAKELQNVIYKFRNSNVESEIFEARSALAQINWIKRFFNLTGEDLK